MLSTSIFFCLICIIKHMQFFKYNDIKFILYRMSTPKKHIYAKFIPCFGAKMMLVNLTYQIKGSLVKSFKCGKIRARKFLGENEIIFNLYVNYSIYMVVFAYVFTHSQYTKRCFLCMIGISN
jgi:hypothetical protein